MAKLNKALRLLREAYEENQKARDLIDASRIKIDRATVLLEDLSPRKRLDEQ
jgi:hypothetical protein